MSSDRCVTAVCGVAARATPLGLARLGFARRRQLSRCIADEPSTQFQADLFRADTLRSGGVFFSDRAQ